MIFGIEAKTPVFSGINNAKSRKKIRTLAPCYFVIWRHNSPNSYFAANAKVALSLPKLLTPIPTLALTQTE